MIVLDYFGQQLEWVWAIVFVHGPYRPEESFIQFWAKLKQWIMMMIFFSTVTGGSSTMNQISVTQNSLVPYCQLIKGGVKLSGVKYFWCQIILASNYLVPNCPRANLPWCQNFPNIKKTWPQIFLVCNLSAVKLRWCQIVLVPYCLDAKLFWCHIVWF